MPLILGSELKKLKSLGVEPGDLLPSEIEALVHACDRMRQPFSAANAEAAGFPVRVSESVVLWRLTVGANVWLDEFAGRWWPSGSKAYAWAHIYAMRHAREKDAFLELDSEERAYKAIRADLLAIDCTEDEILAALERFPADDPPQREGESQTDWCSFVLALEARTGIPADEWTWHHSVHECSNAYHRLKEFAAAQGGSKAPRMKDELDRATTALARTVAGIVRRVKADREAAAAKEAGDGK